MSRVIHFELAADDPQRAIAFYETVFGWQIKKWEGPVEYWLISTGPEDEPGIDGGLARRADPGVGTENTIGVDSLDEALAGVEANGGTIIRPKQAVPGVGWMAYCRDTEGNTFGILQEDASVA